MKGPASCCEAVGTCRQARGGCRWQLHRGWCRVSCGTGSSRCCREWRVLPLPRPEASAWPAGATGDHVRAADGDRLAPSAGRARLRRWLDLLPADGRVAEGRSVGAAPSGPARWAAGGRWDRVGSEANERCSRRMHPGSAGRCAPSNATTRPSLGRSAAARSAGNLTDLGASDDMVLHRSVGRCSW